MEWVVFVNTWHYVSKHCTAGEEAKEMSEEKKEEKESPNNVKDGKTNHSINKVNNTDMFKFNYDKVW